METTDVQKIISAIKEDHCEREATHKKITDDFIAHAKKDEKTAQLLKDYIAADIEWKKTAQLLKDYIAADIEWKKTAQPTIELGKNMQGFGKVTVYLLVFIGLLTSAIFAIAKVFKH